MILVALVGVHGSGKTSTALALAERLGFEYASIEEIHSVVELGIRDPVHRQLLFVAGYVRSMIEALYRARRAGARGLVLDSHPLVCCPYAAWWIGAKAGMSSAATLLMGSLAFLLPLLPRLNLLVYLRAAPRLDTVIERIRKRGRSCAEEEADPEYVRFVDEKLGELVRELGPRIAEKVVEVPAWLELERRVEVVVEALQPLVEEGLRV